MTSSAQAMNFILILTLRFVTVNIRHPYMSLVVGHWSMLDPLLTRCAVGVHGTPGPFSKRHNPSKLSE